jgi:hypothetical protein
MPNPSPETLAECDVDPWKAEWFVYSDAVTERIAELLDRHENAAPLAEALGRLCRGDGRARNSGKVLFDVAGRDTLIFRNTVHGQRYTITRKTPHCWYYTRYEISDEYDSAAAVHRSLAGDIKRAVFSWGDLKFIAFFEASW